MAGIQDAPFFVRFCLATDHHQAKECKPNINQTLIYHPLSSIYAATERNLLFGSAHLKTLKQIQEDCLSTNPPEKIELFYILF
ncbi:hypothetical protein D3C87_1633300 [compost metagenome]